jgi:hypothetical protein
MRLETATPLVKLLPRQTTPLWPPKPARVGSQITPRPWPKGVAPLQAVCQVLVFSFKFQKLLGVFFVFCFYRDMFVVLKKF